MKEEELSVSGNDSVARGDAIMDTSPDFPSAAKASAHQGKPSRGSVIDLSVFDILNIFRKRWFLERDNLIHHILCAQKAKDGSIF